MVCSVEPSKRPKYGWVVACLVFAFVLIFVIVNWEWFFWADFIVCMLDVPGWRYRSWISISYWYLGNDVDTKWIRQTRMLSTIIGQYLWISTFYVAALESNELDMSTSDNWYILFTSCAYILIRYGCQRSIFISSRRPTNKLSTIQWEEYIPIEQRRIRMGEKLQKVRTRERNLKYRYI